MFDTKESLLRLRATGLTIREARSLVSLIQKWIRCSGEEWTVDRIKSIKVDLIRHFAGLGPQKSHSWIHYSKNGPKGPFSAIWRLSRRDFRKAFNAVMVYTGLMFDHPELRVTERQWKKAIRAIQREQLSPDALVKGIRLIHESPVLQQIGKIRILSDTGCPLVDYQPSASRRAPKGTITVPEEEGVLDSLRVLLRRSEWTERNMDILSGTIRGFETSVLPVLEINREHDSRSSGYVTEDPEMGTVSLIQEAGYKLRFAANPHRVYQMALKPLGDALFEALRRVPNDFTFDQESGIAAIQSWLKEGLPACSMDLSNATDNFPLDFQLELLSSLGVSTRWLQFLRDCCRGTWFTRTLKGTNAPVTILRWTVGTPLGLYPTFASFALAHHAVVQWCFRKLKKPRKNGRYPYAIVGDDCTIMDEDVALLYRSIMESWGVEVSEVKTLFSKTTAEFVGRVITSDEVIQGFKWKGRCSDESFVDLCRNLGPSALIFMRARQRAVIQYIADLPEPYGLGWNPYGIPLEERLTPLIEGVFASDNRLRTFTRRAVRASRLVYKSEDYSGPAPIGWEPDAVFLSSDQEVAPLVQKYLPGWESWEEAIWPNLLDVYHQLDGDRTAGAAEFRSMLQRISVTERKREVPTLVVLERKIRSVLERSRLA